MDQLANQLALAALIVAVIGFVVAIYALYRGNRNTSASTVIALNDSLRQALERLITPSGSIDLDQLPELMNLFEIACGIYLENSLAGVSKKLMGNYLASVLRAVVQNAEISNAIPAMLEGEDTFLYIKKFLRDKPATVSVIVPQLWYQSS